MTQLCFEFEETKLNMRAGFVAAASESEAKALVIDYARERDLILRTSDVTVWRAPEHDDVVSEMLPRVLTLLESVTIRMQE